jgi:prepilin peptidase CpaA
MIVGYLDFKTKKISNLWPILNLLIFVMMGLFNNFPGIEHFKIPLGILALGIFLFLLKIMGPGDVKYLFTFFLLLEQPHQWILLNCLIYTTALVGFILAIFQIIKNFNQIVIAVRLARVRSLTGFLGQKLSYAPVIFISWIWYGWEIDILKI